MAYSFNIAQTNDFSAKNCIYTGEGLSIGTTASSSEHYYQTSDFTSVKKISENDVPTNTFLMMAFGVSGAAIGFFIFGLLGAIALPLIGGVIWGMKEKRQAVVFKIKFNDGKTLTTEPIADQELLSEFSKLNDFTSKKAIEEMTRTCPHCAETIKKAANVCKHCGRDILQ